MSNKSLLFLIPFFALIVSSCRGNVSLENAFAPDSELEETLNSANDSLLPEVFPLNFPIYPQAKKVSSDTNKVVLATSDSDILVKEFYQDEFIKNEWELSQRNDNTLVANKGNAQTIITILPSQSSDDPTEFTIEYRRKEDLISAETNNNANNNSDNSDNSDNNNNNNSNNQPSIPKPTGKPLEFKDINEISGQYQQYVKDLAQLGVLRVEGDTFQPNKTITRREYARWLVETNNQFYANNPGKQIRLANSTGTPAL